MGECWERMALQYSMARMLLGWVTSPPSRPISSSAACRAAGKESPLSSWARSRGGNSSLSKAPAVSSRAAESSDSAPKHKLWQKEDKISTPRAAKPSAEDRAAVTGSSSTRSAPQETAALARRVLSMMAGWPRWTKSPLIRQTMASDSPLRWRMISNCFRWPRWKGLYSQIIPVIPKI